ncbi:FtsX-like permease family protein [Fructilactobacillus sp. Tb1]|uniref:FtsX-like permease family protein n=1 Tax=Fructilactobacillus sp. Tb1 TaxID=3422304 RepID=UPI003D2BFF71
MMQVKLALHSLTHNVQRYGLFVLSSTLLIAVNFIFLSILQNETIIKSESGPIVRAMMVVGSVFIALITITFMFYANGFLIRDRNKELGIYNILGMTRGDLDFIVLIQNAIMYVISMVVGLICGITFLELAFLGLRRLLDNDTFKGTIDLLPIIEVAGMFLCIYVLMMSYDIFKMSRLNPINLLKSANKAAVEPKSHWVLGIVGILALATGYYLSVTTKTQISALLTFVEAVILIVIGTYLVFITGSIVILKALRKNKKFYYKPNHFISVSGMLFRMKQNGAGLASICLLVTSTLVVLVASISLFNTYHKALDKLSPYDMIAVRGKKMTNADKQQIKQTAKDNHVSVYNFKMLQASPENMVAVSRNKIKTVNTPNPSNKQLAMFIPLDSYNQWTGKHVNLKDNEVLYYSKKIKQNSGSLNINHKQYQVKQMGNFKAPETNWDPTFKRMYIVANNVNTINQMIGAKQNGLSEVPNDGRPYDNSISYMYAYDLTGTLKHKTKFADEIQKKTDVKSTSYQAKPQVESGLQAFLGSFLFVGALIGIVMSLTTAMIIYYKQVSEGVADQGNFETMQRVGLSYKETQRSIHSQVLMVFMLPIVGAVINLAFAYPALKNIFSLMGMWNQHVFLTVSGVVTTILVVCYVVVYLLTARVYQRIVNK